MILRNYILYIGLIYYVLIIGVGSGWLRWQLDPTTPERHRFWKQRWVYKLIFVVMLIPYVNIVLMLAWIIGFVCSSIVKVPKAILGTGVELFGKGNHDV